MRNTRIDEAQAGIKLAGRNINNLRYADDTTVAAKSEEELKSLLMKVKQKSEKSDLKLSFQKTKIMASGSITSLQIDGETMETVTHFVLGAPKSQQMVIAAMKLKDAYSLEWRRQWQPTPVFFPGESQGRGSLVGCRLWGRTESDTTEST